MSVVSKNPFDLLDDDGESPSPAVKSTTKAPATATKTTPAAPAAQTQRNVPGSAPRGGQRGGRYPSRGGPRNVYREDNGPRNTGPDPATGTTEGLEGPGGFDGERVAPPKKAHHGPDRHTKGPREFRENRREGDRSGRGGRGGNRGARTPASGGERRQFERRSGGLPDSQKKVDQGWGGNDGPKELDAEEEGEKDAQAEETAPQTPAAEDGGWGAGADGEARTGADAEEETPAEPEEVQKSYDQFLAERAEQALSSGFGKKESRQVTGDNLEGKAFVREGIDDFFSGGKQDKAGSKTRAPKKEKVYIEVDGQFAAPPRSGRGGERGGRGGAGRGGDRGSGRGRGAPRGAPRGGRGGFGGPRATQLDGNDERAFPALGA
ncbi:hypothetical protein BD324DRAFT_608653 [Kockovaella imperatae]|uniref:Hyaluronan/mRNA-binding protein domain-containing protein n=1 Tax=Kockovaella imperatae TaxID=4999 RepID=A0A1Y1UIQ2_9TREE|nr:hypothetical protein BD324DRAFT_608653 [Kockovaella imperatae]ORX37374.1 hypothetical protein BD324DRAFT_608653 [Kockovaella imperatae]